jgi:hypothetical protein
MLGMEGGILRGNVRPVWGFNAKELPAAARGYADSPAVSACADGIRHPLFPAVSFRFSWAIASLAIGMP